jgi:hypothetical protein
MLALVLPAFSGAAFAQASDDSRVILPLEAQTCNLPAAPARVSEDADFDALVKAKEAITAFQGALQVYRDCLEKSRTADDLTEGNAVALDQAHDYSVEMEQRVADQFNEARKAYLARKAEQSEN